MTQARIALAVAAILTLVSPPVLGQHGRPQVFVNGSTVAFPEPPQVLRGTLVAPLQPLAAAFGATVAWDAGAPEGTVTSSAGVVVRLAIGDPVAVSAGTRIAMPVAPRRRNGTAWVPAAALLRALGAYVRLDTEQIVEGMSQVTGVTWRRSADGLMVRVAATGPVTIHSLVLTDPDRIAVDVAQAAASLPASRIEVDDRDVVAIRGAQFSTQPYVTRIVLDLVRPMDHTVSVEASGVVVMVLRQAATSPSTPAPTGAPPASLPATPAREPALPEHQHSSGAAAEPRALPPLPEFADGPGAFHVLAVRYALRDGRGRLVISTSQPVTPVIRQFAYPDRLAIDLPGGVFVPRREDLEVGSASIRNIVVAQTQVEPNLTRVVVYLRRKAKYSTSPGEDGRGLVFALDDRSGPERVRRAVVIDPGHGGADSGAIGPTGLRECDVTLDIARHVAEMLEGRGVPVSLTRTADTTVALEDRTDIARREHALAFVSIHANASLSSARRGTETYYASRESGPLAAVIQTEIVRELGEPDRGTHIDDFYVIVNVPAPAILVETAFISNPVEERLLRDPARRRLIAEAIARGLIKFLAARTAQATP